MKNEGKIRILVADDHSLIRMGLVALVNTESDIAVVAEAADGQQAVDLFAKHDPDLVLMDLRMPIKNGIEATIEIRKKSPHARVLMLTTFDGDEDIHQALQAGAQGYVLKGSTGQNLIPALRALAAGQRWIPPEVAKRLADRRGYEELTPREVEVLQQLAKGLANKEIADVLDISENTTKGHLKNITGKLRVADRTEAVTAALQRGIIHLEP
jgi:DNA-binding NarL/FixJ family response regulator